MNEVKYLEILRSVWLRTESMVELDQWMVIRVHRRVFCLTRSAEIVVRAIRMEALDEGVGR